jgi:predicted DNA-binding transcriptional regulator YafY
MSDAVERLLNLALYLADAPEPVTAERIRADVHGYSSDQDQAAFLRMFERDKDQLRAAGFLLLGDEAGEYVLDRARTFASPIDLTAEETAAVRAAATAMLSDPSFPYRDDLRLALAKISSGVDTDAVPAAARLADEDPARQGAVVAALSSAASRGKRARFSYTNSYGDSAPHEVEPYGLFLHDGRWYLVGRDTARDEARTYAVARIEEPSVDTARPATPDFERPADFDVRSFVRLPFQYGLPADQFDAELRFDAGAAWRAESLAAGQGSLAQADDGSGDALWHVRAASLPRLLRFAIENGPGIRVTSPASAGPALRDGLEEVIRAHG